MTAAKKQVGFRPLSGYVLVKPDALEERTSSGLVIPDSAKRKSNLGTVVALPTLDDSSILPQISVGDLVAYGKYTGNDLRIGGEDYLLLREEEIFGILCS